MQYVWFIWSLIILALWALIYVSKKEVRKEMLKMSLITMPFGLTEPLFVPEYWFPPSLFDLAIKTGFDIESLIFSFAIGGIGTVLYNLIFKRSLAKIPHNERNHSRHRLHNYILFVPAIVFLILALFTSLNHIYCGIVAMFIGGLATLYCRPDVRTSRGEPGRQSSRNRHRFGISGGDSCRHGRRSVFHRNPVPTLRTSPRNTRWSRIRFGRGAVR